MAKITAGEHSVERTMHDLRALYGGEEEKAEASKWVFVPEGISSGKGNSFFDEYSESLRGLRKSVPPLPGSRLYFDTDFETDPRDGKDAERLFFEYFNTVSDYFSHPSNIGKLGLVTRQFLSHYVDEDLLRNVDPKVCRKLEELEEEVVKTCPGGRAAMTDLLRMIYNRSLSNVLTEEDAVAINAGKFGERGKSLTLIDMPAELAARRRMDEMQMARQGRIYCLDADTREVYQRGGWSAMEWEEAKSLIEMENENNPLGKAARLKAVDQFYFPQKVCGSVGSCYNLLKAMRDTVISQCRERREFSIVRFVAVLKERGKDGVESGFPSGMSGMGSGGREDYDPPRDYDYDPSHSDPDEERGGESSRGKGIEEGELLPDEEELDAPLKKGLPAPASGGEKETTLGGGLEGDEPAKTREGGGVKKKTVRTAKTPEQKATVAFTRKWGIAGSRDAVELEAIFSRKEGFLPGDYSPEINAFCKTEVLPKGSKVDQWIGEGQRARGIDEAKVLAQKSLPPHGPGKVALVVEKDGGESAVLLAKRSERSGAVLFKEVDVEGVLDGGKIRNGKLFLSHDEGGFKPISGIVRVPYRIPGGAGGAEREPGSDSKRLFKGGILGFLKKFSRGDNVK